MYTRERASILGVMEERTQNVRYKRYSCRNSCLKEGNREHLLKNDLLESKATFYPSVVCFLKRFSQVPYVLGILHPLLDQSQEKKNTMFTTTTQPLKLIAQTADTHSHPIMIDQPIAIQLSGFPPGEPVTIHAFSTPEDGVWRSQASFLADANGCVDVTSQAPLVGSSYSAIDAMGLFWSMQPDPGAASTRDN